MAGIMVHLTNGASYGLRERGGDMAPVSAFCYPQAGNQWERFTGSALERRSDVITLYELLSFWGVASLMACLLLGIVVGLGWLRSLLDWPRAKGKYRDEG